MEEPELVAAARAGDRPAFEELVRRTHVDTFTLAYRLTGNEEDAHDVTQDAYLRAWRAIPKFRGDSQFSTWLYRITANAAATATGRRRRQRADSIDDHDLQVVDVRHDCEPVAIAEANELLDALSLAIDDLPPKLRVVVVLRDVYGLPHEAIAAELGISESAAKVRLHRARRKLREVLDQSATQRAGATARAV